MRIPTSVLLRQRNVLKRSSNAPKVVGRKAGVLPGYAFSQSLKDSGVTWDEPALDKWIADPDAVISGNQMSPPYGGITDAETRKKIIAYLKSISPPDAGTAH